MENKIINYIRDNNGVTAFIALFILALNHAFPKKHEIVEFVSRCIALVCLLVFIVAFIYYLSSLKKFFNGCFISNRTEIKAVQDIDKEEGIGNMEEVGIKNKEQDTSSTLKKTPIKESIKVFFRKVLSLIMSNKAITVIIIVLISASLGLGGYFYLSTKNQNLLERLETAIEKCECDTTKLKVHNQNGKSYAYQEFKQLIKQGIIPSFVEMKSNCFNGNCVLDIISTEFINSSEYQIKVKNIYEQVAEEVRKSGCVRKVKLYGETGRGWALKDFKEQIKEGVIAIPTTIKFEKSNPCQINIFFKKSNAL